MFFSIRKNFFLFTFEVDKKEYLKLNKFFECERKSKLFKQRLDEITLISTESLFDEYEVQMLKNKQRSTFKFQKKESFVNKVLFLNEDEIIHDIIKGKYKYSERKKDNKFLFYNNLEKEFSSIIAGTSNFLFIRNIGYSCICRSKSNVNLNDNDNLICKCNSHC